MLRQLITSLIVTFAFAHAIHAEEYGGIDFPDGAVSFADAVISWDPLLNGGPAPTDPTAVDPLSSLGPPDCGACNAGDLGAVSLGRGGLLEVRFTDNLLTNSGNADSDLHIFEGGPDVEDTFVAVRPTPATLGLLGAAIDADSDGFFEIGKVFGATSSIDIDSFFTGFDAGQLQFDAVQLIDDPDEGNVSGVFVGADIDAVGAIASAVPEPNLSVLCLCAALMIVARCRSPRIITTRSG